MEQAVAFDEGATGELIPVGAADSPAGREPTPGKDGPKVGTGLSA